MIPIRDTTPSKNYPVVNTALIVVNVLVYLLQTAQGADLNRFIYIYGLVPARYSLPEIQTYFTFSQQAFSFLSFMFLHGGFLHLLGNMWSLYIFGDNVEDRMGSARYLVFYLLCGLISGLAHLLLNIQSNIPTIGASGAIAGVMGAYFILFPGSRILTLIPIIFIPWFIEIPAFIFLGIWFVLQFINAAGSSGGIAWWAHIGGFVGGMILLKLFYRVPGIGFTQRLRQVTRRRTTPRLQVIQAKGTREDPNLYGTIAVTPGEARAGSKKMVNIPWGFQKRLFQVKIPPGIETGKKLRLAGQGQLKPDGSRGDLLLTVTVEV
jgi:rhomboid family protein